MSSQLVAVKHRLIADVQWNQLAVAKSLHQLADAKLLILAATAVAAKFVVACWPNCSANAVAVAIRSASQLADAKLLLLADVLLNQHADAKLLLLLVDAKSLILAADQSTSHSVC
ncbi:hypothetical protein LOC67_12535 [Stieleria sp. JC731]|uniref:hypothetical protein n=1 Tax=Pirellulaceae TaxID=2691357 RepID=UPI001E4D56AE|nr:hypothetical protein [Stieleria sp. JC731]MCC9601374.1 hypothetical protein [Stieleria sp. JC731]